MNYRTFGRTGWQVSKFGSNWGHVSQAIPGVKNTKQAHQRWREPPHI